MKPITTRMKALLWMGVVPFYFLAIALTHFLVRLCIGLGLGFGEHGALIYDMDMHPGFGGHYIMGPIYAFSLPFAKMYVGILAGTTLAPTGKRLVRIVLAGLSLCITAYLAYTAIWQDPLLVDAISSEVWVRIALTLLGSAAGIVSALMSRDYSL